LSAPPPTRRTFALFVLGVVAFSVYGSLVPFEFRFRAPAEAIDSFLWAMTNRPLPESRSDGLANVLLGVPLGFGLLGLCRVDRPGKARTAATGLLLLPVCLAFAAAVEFAQLYVPVRTCAGSDVLCQGFGASLGMLGWVMFGQRLTDQARQVAGSGAVVRLLGAYVVVLAFVQTLPMDLTLSPRELYKKLRDRVEYIPFGEFRRASADRVWERTAQLLQLAALYLPVGLLAANLSGHLRRYADGLAKVLALSLGLACGMEAIQLFEKHRTPSATDVVVGATAATLGWVIARCFPRGTGNPTPGPSPEKGGEQIPGQSSPPSFPGKGVGGLGPAFALGLVWLAAVAVIGWQPFAFTWQATPFDWTPGLPREGKSDLFALEEMLTKLATFAPFGVLAAAALARHRLFFGAAAGLAVSAMFEAGQTVFPPHVPCITDVILGGLGAWAGAWVVTRVRFADEGIF
jgi:VanZ family protein